MCVCVCLSVTRIHSCLNDRLFSPKLKYPMSETGRVHVIQTVVMNKCCTPKENRKNVFCVRILAIVKLSSASFNAVVVFFHSFPHSYMFLVFVLYCNLFLSFSLSLGWIPIQMCDLCSESNHKGAKGNPKAKQTNMVFFLFVWTESVS